MSAKKYPSGEQLLQLLQAIGSIHPVGKGVGEYLSKTVSCCNIPKGWYLLRSGEICDKFYFIRKGLLRGFIKEDKKEITTWFALENEFASALSCFITGEPTAENIQAVEDCELLVMSFPDLKKLYLKYPSFNVVGRKITELYYVLAERRAYITRLHDAEKKYQLFLEFNSHYANRVKLTYIATFLGITLETLSRVRAKASIRKKRTIK